MYWTPCARLMKSMTPKTRVSPAAIRNSRTPSCSPLRVWTRTRLADIAAAPASWSLHRAVFCERIGVIGEDLLVDLGLEFSVRPLRHLDEVKVLDRVVVVAELEGTAQGLEVGL